MEIKKDDLIFLGIICAILIIASSLRLGFTGALSIAIIILVFAIPVYFFLNKLDFTFAEKTIFSVFLGLGIVGSLTYYIGLVIKFRHAIILSAILVVFSGILFGMIKNKYLNNQSNQENSAEEKTVEANNEIIIRIILILSFFSYLIYPLDSPPVLKKTPAKIYLINKVSSIMDCHSNCYYENNPVKI